MSLSLRYVRRGTPYSEVPNGGSPARRGNFLTRTRPNAPDPARRPRFASDPCTATLSDPPSRLSRSSKHKQRRSIDDSSMSIPPDSRPQLPMVRTTQRGLSRWRCPSWGRSRCLLRVEVVIHVESRYRSNRFYRFFHRLSAPNNSSGNITAC